MTLQEMFTRAVQHHQAARLAEAEALYRQIIAVEPRRPEAWHYLGIIAREMGRPDLSVQWIEHALVLEPGDPVALFNLGLAFSRLHRLDDAVSAYRRALELRPAYPEACNNLATALVRLGQVEDGLAIYERALQLNPDYHEVHSNIGLALSGQSRRPEAIAAFQRALALQPRYVDAQYSLGVVLAEEGRLEEAIAAYRKALQLQPDHADAHNNLGNALKDQRRIEEAVDSFRRAVVRRENFADAHTNLGLALLLLGQFAEGWREYEWRPATRAELAQDVAAPIWDGNPIPGQTLLIRAEQGFGDTLQFVRYLPLVRAQSRAARVTFECQPELLSLLTQLSTPEIEIVARKARDGNSPAYDWQIRLLSVPGKIPTVASAVASDPYLRADPQLSALWRQRLQPFAGRRVGLAWHGKSSHVNDRNRSMLPGNLLPLLSTPDIHGFSLQVQSGSALPSILAEAGVLDFTSEITDFADSAAFIAELDLVITVDTATAHLAGTLGKPVWLLLSYVPDWRWGLEGDTTPWYPTMRLFRQPRPGDWESVIQRVARELREG